MTDSQVARYKKRRISFKHTIEVGERLDAYLKTLKAGVTDDEISREAGGVSFVQHRGQYPGVHVAPVMADITCKCQRRRSHPPYHMFIFSCGEDYPFDSLGVAHRAGQMQWIGPAMSHSNGVTLYACRLAQGQHMLRSWTLL